MGVQGNRVQLSAVRRLPSWPNPRRTTSSTCARRSVRFAPSNVSDRFWRPVPSLPLRPAGSLRPFGPGTPRSRGPYPRHYSGAFASSGSPLPPSPSPFLAVGLPLHSGTNGAYPVARGGVATGGGCVLSSGGSCCHRRQWRCLAIQPAYLLVQATSLLGLFYGYGLARRITPSHCRVAAPR